MKKILIMIDRKFLWAVLFIVTLLSVSCSSTTDKISKGESQAWSPGVYDPKYWTGDSNQESLQKIASSLKGRQSSLGWITLPPIDVNKSTDIDGYAKKYKLIQIEYVENKGLLRILKPKKYYLYYDINSISKLQKETGEFFIIKVLQTKTRSNSLYPVTAYYLNRETILSTFEISCSLNAIKLIEQMWWNGSWFRGIRYTWENTNIKIDEANPEVLFYGDDTWIKEYNSLLCDVVNNKNEIKAAAWLKNQDKRAAKLKEDKDRKARKVKDDKRKIELDKAVKTCLDLGFKKGTKKYKNCIIELL